MMIIKNNIRNIFIFIQIESLGNACIAKNGGLKYLKKTSLKNKKLKST